MSAERFLLLTVAVAALATVAVALVKGAIDLAEATNVTICPIAIEYDVNQDRVPEKIKILTCSNKPHPWCENKALRKYDCCLRVEKDRLQQCVELWDTVLVYNKLTEKNYLHDVPIGCVCTIRNIRTVKEVQSVAV